MSDTPRTDAEAVLFTEQFAIPAYGVSLNFARTLERELAEAQAAMLAAQRDRNDETRLRQGAERISGEAREYAQERLELLREVHDALMPAGADFCNGCGAYRTTHRSGCFVPRIDAALAKNPASTEAVMPEPARWSAGARPHHVHSQGGGCDREQWMNCDHPGCDRQCRRIGNEISNASPDVTEWPKAREVGRLGEMAPPENTNIRVMLDGDNDVCVAIWDNDSGRATNAGIEFCTAIGGGRSPHTRAALIALMVAMEKDNAVTPQRAFPPNQPHAIFNNQGAKP